MQILCSGRATCCPKLCPNGFWISPRMATPHPPQTPCGSAQSPSQWKRIYWCLEGAFWVAVCAPGLWSCYYSEVKAAHHCQVFCLIAQVEVSPEPYKAPLLFFKKKTFPSLLWDWKLRKAPLQKEGRIKVTSGPRRRDICNKTVLSKSLASKMCLWLKQCMMWWLNPILNSAVSVWWVIPAGQLNTTTAACSLPPPWEGPENQKRKRKFKG